MPDVALIVLAAGEGSRFGGPKQCAKLHGVSLLRRAVINGIEAGHEVLVVTGAHRELVRNEFGDLAVTEVFNHNWQEGMGASIARGFQWLLANDGCEAAIVLLADQPLVTAADLHSLVQAWRANETKIVAADYGGNLGPPCLFPRHHFAELAGLSGEQGARRLLGRHQAHVRTVAMPAAALDIDVPRDLEKLESD